MIGENPVHTNYNIMTKYFHRSIIQNKHQVNYIKHNTMRYMNDPWLPPVSW